jgi:hypothetical protein
MVASPERGQLWRRAGGDQILVDVHQVGQDRRGQRRRDMRVAHRDAFRGELILTMQVQATAKDAGSPRHAPRPAP